MPMSVRSVRLEPDKRQEFAIAKAAGDYLILISR